MDIFYYGIDNNKGGMEIFAFNLIKKAIEKEPTIQFHILTCFEDISFRKELLSLGCEITILPKRTRFFSYYKSLKNVFEKTDKSNSIIHLNVMTGRNLLLFKAARRSKIKTIIVSHSSTIKAISIRFANFLFRIINKNFGTKVGVTKEALKVISNKIDENSIVIHNGINQKLFVYNEDLRSELRNKYHIPDDQFVIGQVGRVSYQKNQIFSCKIVESIKDRDNISLHLFGNIQDKSVEKFVVKNKLQNIIKIHDVINNTNEIYNMFDLLLFPSLFEGAGIVLYEALANGLHCLVSESVPDLGIQTNKITRLPLEQEKWINALNCFREEKDTNRNNELVGSDYDLDTQVDQYLKLYKKLIHS